MAEELNVFDAIGKGGVAGNPSGTNMADELNVFDAIGKYGVAGRPLAKNEERDVSKLAEVGKMLMREAAFDLVKQAHQRPLPFSISRGWHPFEAQEFISGSFCRASQTCSKWLHWRRAIL